MSGGFPGGIVVKNLTCLCKRCRRWGVTFLAREDLLQEEIATHFTILAWKIPWTEEPGRLQSMGSQRVGHDWTCTHRGLKTTEIYSFTVLEAANPKSGCLQGCAHSESSRKRSFLAFSLAFLGLCLSLHMANFPLCMYICSDFLLLIRTLLTRWCSIPIHGDLILTWFYLQRPYFQIMPDSQVLDEYEFWENTIESSTPCWPSTSA